MSREIKSDYQKLSDQIKFIADENGLNVLNLLTDNGLGVSQQDNEYGAHSLLKLSYLNYYLEIFTRIANSHKIKGGFSKVLFIDAFGGSGLVKIKNTRYVVPGSSILAALNGKFDKIISFEIDPIRAGLLSKRLELFCPGKVEVIEGDVNFNINNIVNKYVNSRAIVLFFVDPEGMEPDFSRLKVLMDRSEFVDIMMNYTWGVYRLQGRIEKRFTENDIMKMQSFLPGYVPGKTADDALLGLFEEEFGKPYGDDVPIKSKGNKTEYSMILRVRETKGKTTFLNPMKAFGDIIKNYDGESCELILRTIKGDQRTLQ